MTGCGANAAASMLTALGDALDEVFARAGVPGNHGCDLVFEGLVELVEVQQGLGVDADLAVDDELEAGQSDAGVRNAGGTRTPGPASRRSS